MNHGSRIWEWPMSPQDRWEIEQAMERQAHAKQQDRAAARLCNIAIARCLMEDGASLEQLIAWAQEGGVAGLAMVPDWERKLASIRSAQEAACKAFAMMLWRQSARNAARRAWMFLEFNWLTSTAGSTVEGGGQIGVVFRMWAAEVMVHRPDGAASKEGTDGLCSTLRVSDLDRSRSRRSRADELTPNVTPKLKRSDRGDLRLYVEQL
eukprot:TRINITY_DN43264_c0_g1_i1.p1 TRINITY_DN43264_c0_g1~~TRINITY_DN43264_c0_g1_i1.p1  ORF type:complete len:208 (-),score=47.73 TRINITY_DN43264_c0_g1_i1:40-663(-)